MCAVASSLLRKRGQPKMAQSLEHPNEEADIVGLESLNVGVDWITTTCKREDPGIRQFTQEAHRIRDAVISVTGEPIRKFSFRAYHGWQITGLTWGSREDSDILIASGPNANVYWKLFNRLSTNITRFDLQVTALLYEPIADILKEYYESDPGARRLKKTWVRNNAGGQTLYIGSRRSDQMGRVYDKGLESGTYSIPGALWRYEIEYKGTRAKAVANNLFVGACRCRDLVGTIQSTVFYWFSDRGYKPIFHKHPNTTPVQVSLVARDESTQRRLAWLKSHVRPTVQSLMDRHAKETLEALGLDILLGLVEGETD